MRLQVKARQGQVKESVRRYAEEKLSKLDRRLHDLTLVDRWLFLGHSPAVLLHDLLGQNLEEEETTDERLSDLAESVINVEAEETEETEEEASR